jgi:hypothetical protein
MGGEIKTDGVNPLHGLRRMHVVLHPLVYRYLYLSVLFTLYAPLGVRVMKCV